MTVTLKQKLHDRNKDAGLFETRKERARGILHPFRRLRKKARSLALGCAVLWSLLSATQVVNAQRIVNGDFERGYIDPFYDNGGGDRMFVVHKNNARITGGINSAIKNGVGGDYVLEVLDHSDIDVTLQYLINNLTVGVQYSISFRYAVDDRHSGFTASYPLNVKMQGKHTTNLSRTPVDTWQTATYNFTATKNAEFLNVFYDQDGNGHLYFDDFSIARTDGGTLNKVCSPCDGKPDNLVFSAVGGFLITCGMLDKRLNEITWPGSHNAFANDQEVGENLVPFSGGDLFQSQTENHIVDIRTQLANGISYLELDPHAPWDGISTIFTNDATKSNTRFVHGIGALGSAHVDDIMVDIASWHFRYRRGVLLLNMADIRNVFSLFRDLDPRILDDIWSVMEDYLDDTWTLGFNASTNFSREIFNWHMIRSFNDEHQDDANYVFPTLREMYESGRRVFVINHQFNPISSKIRSEVTSGSNCFQGCGTRIDNFAPSRFVNGTLGQTDRNRLQRFTFEIDAADAGSRHNSLENNAGERIYAIINEAQKRVGDHPVNILDIDYFSPNRQISVVEAANRLNYERFGYNYNHPAWLEENFTVPNLSLNKKVTSTRSRSHARLEASNITDGDIATRWMAEGVSGNCSNCQVVIDLGSAQNVKSATIAWNSREPNSWTLRASNNRSSWTTLNASRARGFTGLLQHKSLGGFWYYDVNNANTYRYYEIDIKTVGKHDGSPNVPYGGNINAGIWEVKLLSTPILGSDCRNKGDADAEIISLAPESRNGLAATIAISQSRIPRAILRSTGIFRETIPENADEPGATTHFRVFVDRAVNSNLTGPGRYSLLESIKEVWCESTVTAKDGVHFDKGRIASRVISKADEGKWVEWDISEFARQHAGEELTYVMKQDEISDAFIRLRSRQYIDPRFSPEIVVTINPCFNNNPASVADTRVRGGQFSATNYGSADVLRVQNDNNSDNVSEAMLRLLIPAEASEIGNRTILAIVAYNVGRSSDYAVYQGATNNWCEPGVTFDDGKNQTVGPALDIVQISGRSGVSWDISKVARKYAGQYVTFAIKGLTPGSDRYFDFLSKETENNNFAPHILVRNNLIGHYRFENNPNNTGKAGLVDVPGIGILPLIRQPTVQGTISYSPDKKEGQHSKSSGNLKLAPQLSVGYLHDAFNERTVSMWIKPNSKADMSLYDEGGFYNGNSSEAGIELFLHPDGRVNILIHDGTITKGLRSRGSYLANEWNHVTMTYNKGTVTLYLNGIFTGQITGLASDFPVHTGEAGLGVILGNPVGSTTAVGPFNGKMDDVRIYSTALREEEVCELAGGSCDAAPSATLHPIEDSFISKPTAGLLHLGNANFGSEQTLAISTGLVPEETYLKFDLSNIQGAVSDAKLRLHLVMHDEESTLPPSVYDAYNASDDWKESTITWNNQPAAGEYIAAAVNLGTYAEFNIRAELIAQISENDTISLRITKTDIITARFVTSFHSSESTNVTLRPELLINGGSTSPPSSSARLASTSSEADFERELEGELPAGLIIYPNPVENTLNIQSQTLVLQATLIGMDGKVKQTARETNGHLIQLSTSTLAKGVYILKLLLEDGSTVSHRILK